MENTKVENQEKKENKFINFFKTIGQRLKNLWNFFSTYEKIWFFTITILAIVCAFLFPEEDVAGVNGKVIMALYVADVFLNILCELLLAKQSKWNFIVSFFVEITEIAICIVCAYRFATMAVTIFFWIPVDIISFIMWNKHKDNKDKKVTEVRKLKGWQRALVMVGIVVWTIGVGTLLTLIDVEEGLLSSSSTITKIMCYLDACCSAVGIVNGLAILFRFEEQWTAWLICTLLEMAMNIIVIVTVSPAQAVLLVLKAGYLTNTIYGMMRWNKYIKNKEKEDAKETNPVVEEPKEVEPTVAKTE